MPVGSSASSSAGSPTTARAIATRCRSPPDSSCGRWVSAVPQPDLVQRRGGPPPPLAQRDAAVEQPVGDVVQRRHARREVELLEDEPDGAAAQRGQLPVGQRWPASRPAIVTEPLVGRSSAPIMCSIVDLPEPDGPTMATSSPSSIVSDTSRSACTPPG